MTQERKIVFELGDIARIRVLCAECGGEVTIPVSQGGRDKGATPPERICPYCNVPWVPPHDRLLEYNLVRVMRQLAGSEDVRPVRLRFEIDDGTD